MASPKLRKPPLPKFWELFIKLPTAEQARIIQRMYGELPNIYGEFLCIDMRSRLLELAEQMPPTSETS